MSEQKIHVLPDENLGGVLREFVEVDRPVKKGDFIVVYGDGHIYEDITVDKPYLVHDASIEYIKFYDDVGDERMWDTSRKDFAVIEPTDIVHIDGQRYRMVDREAKVGERIIIVNGRGWYRDKVGYIYDVIHPSKYDFEGKDNSKTYVEHAENAYNDVSHFVRRGNYRVLEPVEPTEIVTPEEGDDKSVLDLLANLARRVTKLERENKELRHQSHNHRLDIEQIYIDLKSLRENVDVLDERTQPLLALIKAVKDDG